MSQPITDKESSDGEDGRFKYGTTAMQGWRTNMEVRARVGIGRRRRRSRAAACDANGEISITTRRHSWRGKGFARPPQDLPTPPSVAGAHRTHPRPSTAGRARHGSRPGRRYRLLRRVRRPRRQGGASAARAWFDRIRRGRKAHPHFLARSPRSFSSCRARASHTRESRITSLTEAFSFSSHDVRDRA